ncbi:hypothetical protein Tco_1553102, partial [Tanacetum coccineum]
QALQEDTQLPQTSVLIPNVVDAAVFKEWDDRVVRATTTAAGLDAAQASGNITKTQSTTMSNDHLSQEIGSSDRPRVLALEQSKTAQDLVIQKLKKEVKRLEKKQRTRTPGMKLFKIGTSKRKSLDKENLDVDEAMENVEGDIVNAGGAVNTATTGVSAASASVTTVGVSISTAEPRTPPTTTTTTFKDEDLTIAQTLVKMRSEKAKEKGVAFKDVEESARPTKILPVIDPRDKGKEKEQREAQEEVSNAVLREEFNNVQARLDADALLAARLQEEERE